MLKKLLKYDMKSISNKAIPVLLIMLAAMLLLGVVIASLDFLLEIPVLAALPMLCIPMLVLGVIAGSIIVPIIVYVRYYKNLLTDEGYLSFTLPVTAEEHIWSKFISVVIWMVLLYITLIVGAIGALILGCLISGDLQLLPDVFSSIIYAVKQSFGFVITNKEFAGFFGLVFVTFCISSIANIFKYFLAMTIASRVKKNSIFIVILMVIGVNIAISTLTSVINGVTTGVMLAANLNDFTSMLISLSIAAVVNAALAVALYLINKNLLTKKINLN